MKRVKVISVIAVLLAASGVSIAQPSTGQPPFATLQGGPFDVINVGNLNVNLTIPIQSKPGRAGLNFEHNLTYDTSIWFPNLFSGIGSWQPVPAASVPGWFGLGGTGLPNFGGMAFTPNITYSTTLSSGECQVGAGQEYPFYMVTYYHFLWYDPSNQVHTFGGASYTYYTYNGHCGPQTGPQPSTITPVIANDGSGYTIYLSPGANPAGYVVSRLGAVMNGPNSSYPNGGSPTSTDLNGNEITVNGGLYTDTSGLTALNVTGVAPNNTTLTYASTTGAAETFTVKYGSYTVQTNFGCTVAKGGVAVGEFGPTAQELVSEIDLPDGSKYLFGYEATAGYPSSTTSRLAQVTLPTGGVINYTYPGG